MTAVALSSGFPFSWESGENFSSRLARMVRGNDAFDRRYVDHNPAAVKPVLNVASARDPLKVIGAAVLSVLINMMDKGKVQRIRYEGVGYKPVHNDRYRSASAREFDLRIAVDVGPKFANSGSNVSISSLPVIDQAADAVDAAEVADAVQTFVSTNVSPFLTRLRGNFLSDGEKLTDDLLDVKRDTPEASDQVPVRRGYLHKTFLSPPAICEAVRELSHSVMVRNLVLPFVVRDGFPFFNHRQSAPVSKRYSNTGIERHTEGQPNKLEA